MRIHKSHIFISNYLLALKWYSWFLVEVKDLPIVHCQHHVCWWPGDARRQASSHFVDLDLLKYSDLAKKIGFYFKRPILQIPQCVRQIFDVATFCNRNVHICLQHGTLWDVWLVHFGICASRLIAQDHGRHLENKSCVVWNWKKKYVETRASCSYLWQSQNAVPDKNIKIQLPWV